MTTSGLEFWRNKLQGARHVVAPMVDASELAWRLLSRRYGAQLCYTPMYHAQVFVRDPVYRREALASCPEDRPLIIQFCANDPDTLLQAAKYAQPHCEAVDLNLGCPQLIAKRGHYGAYLQDEWELIHKMVNLCAKELTVPITCKARVFEDIDKTVKYAQMLEKAGCKLLTVHGRTREQKGPLTGVASWAHIKAVKENVSIPVFANGNIQYLSDADRCIQETGVEGVMSAEGNLHNPAIFKGLQPPVWQLAEEYIDLVKNYPCPLSYVRGHLFKLLHFPLQIHHQMRDVLGNAKSLEDVTEIIQSLKVMSQEDVKKHRNHELQADLPYPYWICQPYVRPRPGATKNGETRKDIVKRPVQQVIGPNGEPYSINKCKKLRRNPRKQFESKIEKFKKCACGNPKGLKCLFDMCKVCCKRKTHEEVVDCLGHKFLVKTKQINREKWEAAQSLEDLGQQSDISINRNNKMPANEECPPCRNGLVETRTVKEHLKTSDTQPLLKKKEYVIDERTNECESA